MARSAYTGCEIQHCGCHWQYSMQGLDNLTKIELLDLVRVLEERIAQLDSGTEQSRGAQLGVDFIYRQALLVLGNSGIAAFIYDIGIDAHRAASSPSSASTTA